LQGKCWGNQTSFCLHFNFRNFHFSQTGLPGSYATFRPTTDKIKLWLDEDEPGKLALQNILRPPEQNGKNGLLYKTHVQIIKPGLKDKVNPEKVKPYQFTDEEILEILKN
jgi:hypothetical protein